jgi:hypothetical protein
VTSGESHERSSKFFSEAFGFPSAKHHSTRAPYSFITTAMRRAIALTKQKIIKVSVLNQGIEGLKANVVSFYRQKSGPSDRVCAESTQV